MQILDLESGEVLGPNQTGELLHKSEYLMKGYKGDPGATGISIDAEGWVHTGRADTLHCPQLCFSMCFEIV